MGKALAGLLFICVGLGSMFGRKHRATFGAEFNSSLVREKNKQEAFDRYYNGAVAVLPFAGVVWVTLGIVALVQGVLEVL